MGLEDYRLREWRLRDWGLVNLGVCMTGIEPQLRPILVRRAWPL